jgi:predicted DNA-binding transcriptional regulator AlpA
VTIRRYLSLGEIAAAMGVSRDWLYRHVRRLERDHGFPSSVPGLPNRRDPAAIEAWQNRAQGTPVPADPSATGDDELSRWTVELDRRAAATAGYEKKSRPA